MMNALVTGQRDPKALAQLVRHTMRRRIAVLEEAFTGYFTDHHAFLLARMLARRSQCSGACSSGQCARSAVPNGWTSHRDQAAGQGMAAERGWRCPAR